MSVTTSAPHTPGQHTLLTWPTITYLQGKELSTHASDASVREAEAGGLPCSRPIQASKTLPQITITTSGGSGGALKTR